MNPLSLFQDSSLIFVGVHMEISNLQQRDSACPESWNVPAARSLGGLGSEHGMKPIAQAILEFVLHYL